jgi:5-methylcytosine-specific restriction enzyme subunit McrC
MSEGRVIQVFEDRQTQLELSAEEIADILKLKSIIGENNVNLQANGKLLINHYVGFVQINRTRLLIYPKVARHAKNENIYSKALNRLMKLLAYSDFVAIKKIPTPQQLEAYTGDLLELFISLFVDELLTLLKRDINRSYIYNIENQSFIKGKIDFPDTIKKNSYKKHLHYVKFDDFTENILMNQVFKVVLDNLLKRTTVKDNKLKLKQALLWLEDVKPVKLTNDIWDKVVFTRLNNNYRPVFNMAKLFYYNSQPSLHKGDELSFSFLVPLNQLFEAYVYKLINNHLSASFTVRFQGPIKYLGCLDGQNYLQLKPDITVLKSTTFLCLLDAKYKEILYIDDKLNLAQADIYQMLAYSIRYQCNHIALVYPRFANYHQDIISLLTIEIPVYNEKLYIQLLLIDLDKEPEIMAQELISAFLGEGPLDCKTKALS